MKHKFKFNPLATAILTLLCGSSISSYAEQSEPFSTVSNNQLKESINEAYPGQQFLNNIMLTKVHLRHS